MSTYFKQYHTYLEVGTYKNKNKTKYERACKSQSAQITTNVEDFATNISSNTLTDQLVLL